MKLLSLRNISLAFGNAPLLEEANFSIESRQRICVIGRNGAGKSSLLKLINKELLADSGEIERSQSLQIAKLVQEIPENLSGNIYDMVADGLGNKSELLKRYHRLNEELTTNPSEALLKTQEKLHAELDACDGWQSQHAIDSILSKMELTGEESLSSLSGGMIRRVLLARTLVSNPDILLLDEPTNHLDIPTIEWLENFLLAYKKTIIFITHDRSLIKKLATQIVEIDSGQLSVWNCTYEKYLERKAQHLLAQEKAQQLFDKRLADEEKWIRKGIQARRTRNEGRVRKLISMRREKQQRRERAGSVNLKSQQVNYSGKMIFDIDNISFNYNNKEIIRNFSMRIMRGDKIAVIGKNGCGKSTLLKLLMGELQPDSGSISLGTLLEICYFDQKREQLDEEKSVIENVSDSSEYVEIAGKSQHIISYLRDFLFTPEKARTPVKALSGGERHRLLLARMFTKSCNLLILDEPTNDLDAETLDLLQERLVDFEGTLILVSHDRDFINNVVTSTLAFGEEGELQEYVGDYDDYLRQRTERIVTKPAEQKSQPTAQKASSTGKLSYKKKRELEELPHKIESLEKTLADLQTKLSDGDFYKNQADDITPTKKKVQSLEEELRVSYARWEALDLIK